MSETSERLGEIASHIATSPKTAATVATGSLAAGGGTLLDQIPDILGIIASIMGICLSVVLIFYHVSQFRKTQLEIDHLRAKEAERLKRAEESPKRRFDDNGN